MHGVHRDWNGRISFKNLSCCHEAVHHRHLKIEEDYVGFARSRKVHGFLAVCGFSAKLPLVTVEEHSFEGIAERSVVVSY